jgi:membrane protein YqaA with SNARE-associated domain
MVALWAHEEAATGNPTALTVWVLSLGAFYLSLCNGFLPLPTTWVILLLASENVMVSQPPFLRIAVLSVVGSVSTMVANLNEYHVLGYFFRARLGERIRRTRVYRWALRWFDLAPFQTLTLFAFIPIPVDAVRWLAILRRYSRPRYAAAYFIGRLPRYALLAGLSAALHLRTWEIVLIQVAIVVLLGGRLVWSMLRRIRSSDKSDETGSCSD